MNKNVLLKFVIRFLLAYLILLALFLQFGQQYLECLLPLYRWEIGWLYPDYHIVSLSVGGNNYDSVISLDLELIRYIVVAGHTLSPASGISSSTLAGHALQHPLLMLSLVAAVPASSSFERVMQIAISIPILLLLEMADVPFVLLGSIEDLILANLAPDTNSCWVVWMNFMNGGGRLALSIVAAFVVVGLAKWISALPGRQPIRV